jgi:predicted phage terminase large subunit-like protein
MLLKIPSLFEIDKELAERSLSQFVIQAWHVLEPGTKYLHNWTTDAIAEHLEAVSSGDIQNLIINVPPGMMKSLLVAVFWPCWDWIAHPSRKFVSASYEQTLSIRDASKARTLIQSEWYQQRWGDIVSLKRYQNEKRHYENTKEGSRTALSVGGGVTGKRGDIRILDDPHSADGIKSEAQRETDINWLRTVWPTRKNSEQSAEVLIMQRLHEMDATGLYMKEIGGYELLCLPMRYDGSKSITSLGEIDRRTEPNELLFPERFSENEVTRLEKILGRDAAGQLQQRPTSAEGGIFLKTWWEGQRNRYDSSDNARRNKVVARWLTFDTALKNKSTNDKTAMCVWELSPDYKLYVREMWSDRILGAMVPSKVETLATQWNRDGKLRNVIIEDKASGITAIQTLQMSAPAWLANIIVPFEPKGDKEFRGSLASVWCERDCIQFPHPADDNGDWYTEFLDTENGQLWIFPNAEHDDLVDAFTMGIIYLEHYIEQGWRARNAL